MDTSCRALDVCHFELAVLGEYAEGTVACIEIEPGGAWVMQFTGLIGEATSVTIDIGRDDVITEDPQDMAPLALARVTSVILASLKASEAEVPTLPTGLKG
jgi:hypothetical protein